MQEKQQEMKQDKKQEKAKTSVLERLEAKKAEAATIITDNTAPKRDTEASL